MSRSSESLQSSLITFKKKSKEKSITRIVEVPSSDTSDKEHDGLKDPRVDGLEEFCSHKEDCSRSESCEKFEYSYLLDAPILVRENIYRHLGQRDRLMLRRICPQFRDELCVFGKYNATFRKPLTSPTVPIPFPHLKLLTIDNQFDDLPWFGLESRPFHADSKHEVMLTSSTQYAGGCRGTVDELKLLSVNQSTLNRVANLWSIKAATIGTDVFERKFPTLQWHNLTSLRLHFYVVRFVGTHELEMLENFDALCRQKFRNLRSLQICLRRSYLNPQSSFSIRALRFMAQHWQTLKDMAIEMEAERCDIYPQSIAPEFSDEELLDLAKVQLRSLKIDATELMCRKCRTWQSLIRQQKALDSLKVSIYSAEGHPMFFYPLNRDPKTKDMKTVSIGLWGLHSHYPIDFRRLTNGIEQIYNIRLFRSPVTGPLDLVQHGPEISNMAYIPSGIVSLTIKGFIVSSSEVEILLKNTPSMSHLTLKNCGNTEVTGMRMAHLKLAQSHPSLATGCVDVVNPVNCPGESFDLFVRELQSGRMDFKVIASRDGTHTFLLVDRARATQLLQVKDKRHDEEVLPGLDYPTGFLSRFDNWKIRA